MNYDSILDESSEEYAESMTLGELMTDFANAGDLPVVFMDAASYTVGDLCSWRGSYDLPSLTYEQGSKTGNQLFEQLQEQLNQTHCGYKGGNYTFSTSDCPYVSKYGWAEKFMIVKTEQENDCLVLYTKIIPY